MFQDYLNLRNKSLSKVIILYGRSGSGKSTYATFIKDMHPDYKVIDEVWSIWQLAKLFYFRIKFKKIIICSHLPKRYFLFFSNKRFYDMDNYPEKIKFALEKREFTYAEKSIELFYSRFKTSFVDMNIILETAQSHDFDEVLENFLKKYKIEHTPDYS